MLTVEGNAAIVGVAELRTIMKAVLAEMKTRRVILTKRNRPVGVLVDYKEFRKMEELIGALEDYVLGKSARERAGRKAQRWITLEEAERKLGLR